jgi:hypothetical protein
MITGFFLLSPSFSILKDRRFSKCNIFPSSGDGMKDSYFVGYAKTLEIHARLSQ